MRSRLEIHLLSWMSTPLYDCRSVFMSFILRAVYPNPDSLPILGLRTISGNWVDNIVVLVAFAHEFTQKTRHDGHIGCFYFSNGEFRKRLHLLLTPKLNRIIPLLLTSVQGGRSRIFWRHKGNSKPIVSAWPRRNHYSGMVTGATSHLQA